MAYCITLGSHYYNVTMISSHQGVPLHNFAVNARLYHSLKASFKQLAWEQKPKFKEVIMNNKDKWRNIV